MKVLSLALHQAAQAGVAAVQHPVVAMSFVGLITAAPLQLYLLNSTLASSPMSYAVPVYQALLTLLTTAAGGVFFREFARTSTTANLAYSIGALTSLAGLGVLGNAKQAAVESGQVAELEAQADAESMAGSVTSPRGTKDERAPLTEPSANAAA